MKKNQSTTPWVIIFIIFTVVAILGIAALNNWSNNKTVSTPDTSTLEQINASEDEYHEGDLPYETEE